MGEVKLKNIDPSLKDGELPIDLQIQPSFEIPDLFKHS
jgi:hypothetical protein